MSLKTQASGEAPWASKTRGLLAQQAKLNSNIFRALLTKAKIIQSYAVFSFLRVKRHNEVNILSGKIYVLFAGWEVRMAKNCDRGQHFHARGHSFSPNGPT